MIAIRINNQSVDISPGTSLNLEQVSPYLNFNVIEPSRVLPFTLPFTPQNRKIFQWAERSESTGLRSQTYYAEKYSDSHCIEKGIVEILDINNGYNLVFIKNLSDLFGEYGKELITKMPLGSEPAPALSAATKDPDLDAYCFPTVINPAFYGVYPYGGKVNDSAAGSPVVPMFFVKWLLLKMATICDFTVDGPFMTHPVWKRLVIYNTFSLDSATVLDYRNHLPELRLMEFLMELRRALCLTFDFDMRERRLTIGFFEDILDAPTTTNWSNKTAWDYNKKPVRDTRMEMAVLADSNDATTKKPSPNLLTDKYLTAFDPQNPREGIFKIDTKWGSLLTDAVTGLPFTEQAGISPQYNQQTNKFAARLLFYDSANVATSSRAGQSLHVTGPTGLQAARWAKYEAWVRQSFETKQRVWLTSTDVASFSFRNKVFINGQNYLVSQLNTQLPIVGQSQATLMRVQ